MRFIFDLPPPLAKAIAENMERGAFSSVDEMAADAFRLLLGLPELGGTPELIQRPDGRRVDTNYLAHESSALQRWLRIPSETAGATGEVVVDNSECPTWIWGMVNRVFPLKLVVRVCANLCAQGPITLQAAYRLTSDCAFEIGKFLETQDRARALRRNEARAVSLPGGDDIVKSKLRFAHQFVGRRGTERPFVGGAFHTGLLGPAGTSNLIAPTVLGWAFARIPNPIFDGQDSVGSNLSAEECDYYLTTLARTVPAERAAFAAILGSLTRHPMTPGALARAVCPIIGPKASTVVADTARAGAVGRLIDLRAVTREPKGRSAVISITQRGEEALMHLSEAA